MTRQREAAGPAAGEGDAPPDGAPRTVRSDLIAATARLIAAQGFGALSIRRVAAEAKCSTIAIYHYFESKQGLLDAVYLEGFTRLADLQRPAADLADPLDRVRMTSTALREMAMRNPNYYRVMFNSPTPEMVPSSVVREPARRNYARFLDAVRAWAAAEALVTDAETAAHVLWTAGHGLIMIELAGNTPHVNAAEAYETAVEALLRGLTRRSLGGTSATAKPAAPG